MGKKRTFFVLLGLLVSSAIIFQNCGEGSQFAAEQASESLEEAEYSSFETSASMGQTISSGIALQFVGLDNGTTVLAVVKYDGYEGSRRIVTSIAHEVVTKINNNDNKKFIHLVDGSKTYFFFKYDNGGNLVSFVYDAGNQQQGQFASSFRFNWDLDMIVPVTLSDMHTARRHIRRGQNPPGNMEVGDNLIVDYKSANARVEPR